MATALGCFSNLSEIFDTAFLICPALLRSARPKEISLYCQHYMKLRLQNSLIKFHLLPLLAFLFENIGFTVSENTSSIFSKQFPFSLLKNLIQQFAIFRLILLYVFFFSKTFLSCDLFIITFFRTFFMKGALFAVTRFLMGYTKPCSHPLPPTPIYLQLTAIYFQSFLPTPTHF